MTHILILIRLLKFLLVSKALVASAIGIKMDEKEEFFFSDTYLMTNFQFQPFEFLFNPTGKAPPTRGRSVFKKKEKKRKKDFRTHL